MPANAMGLRLHTARKQALYRLMLKRDASLKGDGDKALTTRLSPFGVPAPARRLSVGATAAVLGFYEQRDCLAIARKRAR